MMKRIVQLLLAFTGGVLGYLFIADLTYLSLGMVGLDSLPGWLVNNYTGALAGALIFYLLFFWSVDPIVRFIQLLEDKLMNFPVADLIFGTVGLVVGLLLAFLVTVAVNNIDIAFISAIVPIFLTLLLGYLGFQVGYKKKDELLSVFRQSKETKDAAKETAVEQTNSMPVPKLLDTSVIIDGRIADICQTGFLEGKLVIPNFVLEELQHIADSSDSLKRNRGRRGLDILKRIQKEIPIEVEITDADFDEIQEVDSKLVKLAKKTNGLVVTNDFNLNKVCDLQGVSVLNINDLANAVKPVVLPGEEMAIQIIKDGKEQNQGIGYLDDGTMIVVEGGRNAIGKTIDVIVTSVLQTSAGRMIFAKPKSMDKAQ